MTERESASAAAGPARPGGGARSVPVPRGGSGPRCWLDPPRRWLRPAWLGSALGFLNKAACRSGDWNVYLKQFQAHCYTDIYPLYFGEQLSSGKVPYYRPPGRVPGAHRRRDAGRGLAGPAHLRPFVRGREFFDVTVVMLALFSLAGTLATAYAAGRSRRWTALGVALAPGLILASFINWDLIAMGLVALGMAAWAARRTVLAGVLLGLAVATKFYPLFFFGPLLLLCLRAGRLRAFAVAAASAAAAWLAVNLPVALAAPAGWSRFYSLNTTRAADWGSIWYYFETEHWPVLGSLSEKGLNTLSALVFAGRLRAHRRAHPRRSAAAARSAGVLPGSCRVPAGQQGVVAAVRHLAGPARGARQAPAVGVRGLAGGRGRVLLCHLGLPDHRGQPAPRSKAASAPGSTSPRCSPGSAPSCCCAGSWSGTSCAPRPIWSGPGARMTRPEVSSPAHPTGRP